MSFFKNKVVLNLTRAIIFLLFEASSGGEGGAGGMYPWEGEYKSDVGKWGNIDMEQVLRYISTSRL
jgi:hypothetical protein